MCGDGRSVLCDSDEGEDRAFYIGMLECEELVN